MTMDNLVPSLRLLWRHLNAKGRVLLAFVLLFLIVSSLAEALSALALFTYITLVIGHENEISGAVLKLWPGFQDATLWDRAMYGGVALMAVFLAKNALDVLTRFILLRFVLKTYEKVSTHFFSQLLNRPLERFLTRSIQDYQHSLDVAVMLFRSRYQVPWGEVLAATVIASVPIVVLVLTCQQRIVAGLSAGASKG